MFHVMAKESPPQKATKENVESSHERSARSVFPCSMCGFLDCLELERCRGDVDDEIRMALCHNVTWTVCVGALRRDLLENLSTTHGHGGNNV